MLNTSIPSKSKCERTAGFTQGSCTGVSSADERVHVLLLKLRSGFVKALLPPNQRCLTSPRTRPAAGQSWTGRITQACTARDSGPCAEDTPDKPVGGWVGGAEGHLWVSESWVSERAECPGERDAQSTAASRRLPHRLVPHSRWCRKNDADAVHPGLLSHSGELWVCPSFRSETRARNLSMRVRSLSNERSSNQTLIKANKQTKKKATHL